MWRDPLFVTRLSVLSCMRISDEKIFFYMCYKKSHHHCGKFIKCQKNFIYTNFTIHVEGFRNITETGSYYPEFL